MAGGWYNGYSWKQREAPGPPLQRAIANGYRPRQGPCDLCGDPDRPTALHSEDYSPPFSFEPPQSYLLCKACHLRVHKRFGEPKEDWQLFLRHLRTGGYAAEFTKRYPLAQRRLWRHALAKGEDVSLPLIRERRITGDEWWLHLTLDPESLTAAWARPRPLRPRPSRDQYQEALNIIGLTDAERLLLTLHAQAPHCSISTRDLSRQAVPGVGRVSAGVAYKSLGQRLCRALDWTPDPFKNGHPNWVGVLAECWKPDGRDTEWVLVPSLRDIHAWGL